MGRATRTFKLRLSPAGMDLLIEAHCHLIRSTRQLLAWGTTLHIAVDHLDTIPAERVGPKVAAVSDAGLSGDKVHFLGAPSRLQVTARAIADRVADCSPPRTKPTLFQIYLVALQVLVAADGEALCSAHRRVVAYSDTAVHCGTSSD